jgi:predicted PhzF superfamily epimerase YddE/YHI9
MRQHPPVFGTVLADLDRLAAALGLPPDALGTHPDLPAAQVVGTGADHLMTGVTGRAAVDAARPDQSALAELLRPAGAQGHALGRPSHIRVALPDIVPAVTGSAVLSARGTLLLP